MRRSIVALALALLLGAVGGLAPTGRAFAHAAFESSDPADGSVLASAPATVTLSFSEPVLDTATSATLLEIGTGTTVDLHVRTAGDGSVELTLPSLGDGAYVLRYTVVDPADLHRTVGSISFGVGVAVPVAADTAQLTATPAQTAANGLADLALILGGGAVTVLLAAGRTSARVRRRASSVLGVAAVTLAVAWIAALVLDAAAVGWTAVRWLDLLTGSTPGRRALIGGVIAVAIVGATRMLRHDDDHDSDADPFVVRVLAACWAAAIAFAALGGHNSIGGSVLGGWVLRVVHLASLCAWVGGVAVTWWSTRGETRAADVLALWRRMSVVAGWALAATGVSGLLLSARTISTVTALLSTTYGRVVVVKTVAVLGLAATGAVAARRIATGRAPRRRLLAAEVGAMAAVVVVAAFLGGQAPAVGARFEPLTATAPQVLTADVADLTLSALLEPARPGPNLLQLRLLDTRRPSPGAVDGVTVTVTDAAGNVVDTLSGVPRDGLVEWDSLVLPAPGDYRLSAAIDRPAAGVPGFEGSVSAEPMPAPRAATVLSDTPWGAIAAVLAAVWAVLVAVGALGIRRNTRDSRAPSR